MMLFYPHADKQCDHCQRVITPKHLVAVYGAFTYLCLQCYENIIRPPEEYNKSESQEVSNVLVNGNR